MRNPPTHHRGSGPAEHALLSAPGLTAGARARPQYLSCLCNIAACLSGSEEINELANCTDNIAQISWCTCAPARAAGGA